MLENKINYAVYLSSVLTVLTANELPVIGPDAYFYAFLGMAGSLIGSFVRLVRRDEQDVDNKVNFFYWKDLFKIIAWALVGGFLTLVFAANGWYPWLAVLCSLFTPKFWDVMEEAVPSALRTIVNRVIGDSNNKKETKETDGEKK